MTSPGTPSEPANAARPEIGVGPSLAPVGRVLAGRYEILEALGTGPLLAAFRARDRALNRIVVVKTLLPALEAGERSTALADRLRAGLSGVVSLSHTNVTRVYDVGRDDAPEGGGLTFLAEEYVRGIDLKERIRRVAPFSLTASVDVAVAVAEALEYAHARGVVHGDLRPQNVLIGPEGQIKVSNFGLSSALALVADPAALLPVVPYTAPEVAESRTASASGDLYALGVILYEMLAGDLPYRGDTLTEVARRHASDPVPAPRVLNPGVPRALNDLVQKALAKRPGERYGSASALLADLRTVRDALRQGASLSWSPLDAAAAPPMTGATNGAPAAHGGAAAYAAGETATVMTAGRRASPAAVLPREAESTIVMPTSSPTAAPRQRGDGRAPVEPRRRNGGRWLAALNLFLFTLLVASVAALGYVALFFVRAPQDVVVPSLVGRSLEEAKTLGHARNFKVDVVEEIYRENEPAGTIYQMKPTAGLHIREGRTVSVWVSKGPRLVDIPDVRDMSIERARLFIEKAGLRIGKVKKEFDEVVAAGNVIQQSPDAQENKPRNTRVDLVISKGLDLPPAPIEPAPLPEETPDNSAAGTLPGDEGAVSAPPPADDGTQTGNADGITGDDSGGAAGRSRVFDLAYPIPSDDAQHRIRIDVTDREGMRTVYDDVHESGRKFAHEVEGYGRLINIKLYDNDVLKYEKTHGGTTGR